MDLLLEAASLRQEGSESSNTISADEMMSGVIDQDDSDNDDGCSCENKPKRKRQHTNDEQEDSDDMKKQSSDLHNENERKRRKSMKYAVSSLRQQLTNKPRKSAVNTVLQAAYDEIQDLKSEEKDKAEIVEELKRKHTVLKYLLEKTINELKQQSPKGGTCLSPLVENHTCAAALEQSTSVPTNNNRAGYHWPATGIPYNPPLPSNITMAAIQQSQTYMAPITHPLPTVSPPTLFPFPFPRHSPPITIRSPFFPPIPYLPATTPFTMSPVYYPPSVLLSSGNYPLTNNFVTTPDLITNIRPPTKRSSLDKQSLKGRDKSKPGQHCGNHLVSDESKRMVVPNTSSDNDFQEHTITVVNGYSSSYRESVIADNRQTKSQTTDDNL